MTSLALFLSSIYFRGGALGAGFLYWFVPYAGTSLLFILVTNVSHIQPEVQAAECVEEPDFFKRQARTSVDYQYTSQLWGFLTGGLNNQSLHRARLGPPPPLRCRARSARAHSADTLSIALRCPRLPLCRLPPPHLMLSLRGAVSGLRGRLRASRHQALQAHVALPRRVDRDHARVEDQSS